MPNPIAKSLAILTCGLFGLTACANPTPTAAEYETASLEHAREATHNKFARIPGVPPAGTIVASDETLDECELALSNQSGYQDTHEQYRCALIRQIVFVSTDPTGPVEPAELVEADVFEANGLSSTMPFGPASIASLARTDDAAYAAPLKPTFGNASKVLDQQRDENAGLLAGLATGQESALVLILQERYFDSDKRDNTPPEQEN